MHIQVEFMKQKTQKNKNSFTVIDGNEAAAYVAYRTNEICIIYPITPASSMGELPDQWAAENIKNIWDNTPQITTMQSEGGAAGAVHGALQTGALATTFTSSQGLLLMIPNMYRIAGELLPTVFHVATRALAFQGMSIYGDHSDIYAVRATGFAMLAASSVQEAHDMALIAQTTSLKTRIPFLHFFDGFRTSHEVTKIELLADKQIRSMIDDNLVFDVRKRRLTPENPTIRGVVSDYDIYFQGREAVNPFYNKLPQVLEDTLNQFKKITGRHYKLVEYFGDPQATQVIIIMGSAAETVQETVAYLNKKGQHLGVLKIRLFRPFPKKQFLAALPKTCKKIAVLDRTKEVGAAGEPLYEEVTTTIFESSAHKIKVIGGRYGIASKEFTPTMIQAVFKELKKPNSKNHFTIGINDDLTNTSLSYDHNFDIEPKEVYRAIFYGLGSDGTVSANKNSIKIVGEETDLFTQGYFVYDAKKTGSRTVSYLRFSPKKIHSAYLINSANFIGCHQFSFVEKMAVLERAAPGAIFLLNTQWPKDKIWDHLPKSLQQTMIDKKIKLYVIDAYKIAHESGMKNHINTIMQVCFFALSNIIPRTTAITKIKNAIKKTYANKGEEVLRKNYLAVDNTLANLTEVDVPNKASSAFDLLPIVSSEAPKFIQNVVSKMLAGKGHELPVSAFPADGVYPTNSARWEKRGIAHEIPKWIPENCIQCGLCRIVCPHSAIRSKCYPRDALKNAPKSFLATKLRGQTPNNDSFTLQIYAEDCTGCGACLEVCPINKGNSDKKALVMTSIKKEDKEQERTNLKFFTNLPNNCKIPDKLGVKELQHVEPMFEFCGACAGCGETPYIKLLTQLFGDRLVIANGVGCTIAYGGYLPTFPWTVNSEGHGPAFGSSLFEDNAEFGFGFLLTIEKHRHQAEELLVKLQNKINNQSLLTEIANNPQKNHHHISKQRQLIQQLKNILAKIKDPNSKQLLSLADHLVKQSVWEIGGDGWAYDIGYGGLDHVLASGKNIKVLVLDTEVYSNTGGQASKATPRGAVVKFAANGKPSAKKDLGLMLMTYGNIYVASVALGANPNQAIKALHEADNYDGPAIVIAYSHCIAHGINMAQGMQQQKLAVKCGHWPLYRYNPDRVKEDLNPLQIDSEKPSIPFAEFAKNENRYQILMRTKPELAQELLKQAEADIKHRWKIYEALQRG